MAFDSKNLSRNRFAEQVMGSTLIKCSCDILVKSSELESHKLNKCTNIRLKCKFEIFGCTELSDRSLLQQHEEKCDYHVSDKVFPQLQLIANFREFYGETLYQITTPQMKPESYEVQFKIPETLHDTLPQVCFTSPRFYLINFAWQVQMKIHKCAKHTDCAACILSFTRVSEGKICRKIKVGIFALTRYFFMHMPRACHQKAQYTFFSGASDVILEEPLSMCSSWPHASRNLRLIFMELA
jgi:hypothetical protein